MAVLCAILIAAFAGYALFVGRSTTPMPIRRSSQTASSAAIPPPVAKQAPVSPPRSTPAQEVQVPPPQAAGDQTQAQPQQATAEVNRPPAAANPIAVSPRAASDLLKLRTGAVSRAQSAAAFYASSASVMRKPRAGALAGQAKAALAGVREATDQVVADSAALDHTAPGRVGALLRHARVADEAAAAHNRRLHAILARARVLAAPGSPSRTMAETTPGSVEPMPLAAERAMPPSPVTDDDRRRYAAAVRSYRNADACYRDLAARLSRAYGPGRADVARNRDLSRRVWALYDRLHRLASAREALAGASADGPTQLEDYQRQVRDYVDQCSDLRLEL